MNGLLAGLRFRVSILDVPAGSRAMTVTSNIPCGVSVIGEVTVGACSVCRKTLHDGETCTDCCTVCCQPRLHCICCPLLGRPPCLCYAGGGNPGDGSGGGNPTDPTPGGEGGSNGNKPGDGWKPPTDPDDGDDDDEDEEEETPTCNGCSPCICVIDAENHKSNPLKSMSLQPPSDANIKGATFGTDVRRDENGAAKAHQGVDLYGTVGTAIYSMFEGTVVGTLVTGQPDMVLDESKRKVYPADYTGDKNGAGNRISVQSTVNGQTITVAYWHLQAGTPVGTNPDTGVAYKVGDTVKAGAIVGYVGITGNASPDRPHLHLGVKNSAGSWINPTTYLNATVSTTSTSITIAESSQCNC